MQAVINVYCPTLVFAFFSLANWYYVWPARLPHVLTFMHTVSIVSPHTSPMYEKSC